ncbi:efflux RND transporter periplasmic adaptor subunit [Roseateles saccharophilus]|uniref:Membrane fusion protein (Multidrug efflux system) n=1 Tax=Roseateles saccharophilus TaxID=304 RepID=A0A4R3U7E1_ROSSA|nr:efflux RND transporter periplasmic adaptor subunit [Roseateles saccharophilus]MDG0835948.1 efflux RND transporter periplasmic adaptor subunit [Roseateles saccharophilus]TCU82625.1 membrane fusion protein (multidrug efflux system) [Roseateles saccharophilus]
MLNLPSRPSLGTPAAFTLLTVAVAVIAAFTLSACSPAESQAAKAGAAPAAKVGVVTVLPQRVELSAELAGRTVAYQTAEVRPQVTGIVKTRAFTEGSDVKTGQLLYQIDPASYQTALDSARATLAKAEANAATARLKAGRYDELAGIDAVSKQLRDDTQAALKQAQADVAAATAAVRAAQIDLDRTLVAAPIAGRIGRSAVTPGALVTANQAGAMATLQQLDPIYVDVTQTSAELLRLQRQLADGTLQRDAAGQARVKLLLEDGSTYALEGRLQFSELQVDPSSGSVTLRAQFPNPRRQLLPGMYVRAQVQSGVQAQALLAPQSAVSRDARGNATAMVLKDGKAEARVLQTGAVVNGQWLVTSGLAAGDQLIVDGLQRLRPGMAAEAAAPAAKAATGAPATAGAAR